MESKKMIALGDPVLGEAEKKALIDVIDSGWLTMGDRVKAFESAFAKLHGVQEAVAVNSCTSGLHLCLTGLGIGPGDEVLTPSLTFVATVNSILYAGAKPIFVDTESLTNPHISIKDGEQKLTKTTKAVMVMHYGGYLVDMPSWRRFADAYGLALIEDAAHSPGVPGVGILGDATAFSFFTNKNMTTSEGGMVFARNEETLNQIRYQRAHGMTTGTLDRQRGHAYSYDVITLGFNYRLDELRAAMGMAQLERLPQFNQKRLALTQLYRKLIAQKTPSVQIPFDDLRRTAAHLMAVILPKNINRQAVMAYLRDKGVQSSIHYPAIHRFTYYQQQFPHVSLPITEEFCDRELTLPLHPFLTDSDVETVTDSLKSALDNISSP
jgi:dTDP-4-amino-4,6-dideoxygalactose transaminase